LYLINGKPEIYIIYIYIYRTKVKREHRKMPTFYRRRIKN